MINSVAFYQTMNDKSETEKKIFEAARDVFHRRGFDGARMQEIADKAKINKALLHYYYRSKDKLFEAVFREALKRIGPIMFEALDREIPLEKKLKMFVSNYIDLVTKHPFIPGFIMHEMHTNKTRFKTFLRENKHGIIKLNKLKAQLKEGIDKGQYKNVSVEQLIINVFSLCAFPFAARPVFQTVLDIDDAGYRKVLEERKKLIPEIILMSLKK